MAWRRRTGSILGLAITDGAVLCAQVGGSLTKPVVQKVGRFVAESIPGADPSETGRALGAFLREHGFHSSRAVVGLPARWLMSQDKDLPPGTTAEVESILRIHAERMTAAADKANVVVDYTTGTTSADTGTTGTRALLVAILSNQLDGVTRFATAAGLNLLGATPTALALQRLLGNAASGPLVLLGERGAEMVVSTDGSPRVLRHIAAPVNAVATELRRALATAGGSDVSGVVLWDGAGLTVQDCRQLGERLNAGTIDRPTLQSVGASVDGGALNGAAQNRTADAYLPAVAVAALGLDRPRSAVNFLQTKLVAPTESRFGRRTVWAALVAVLVVVGIATLYVTVLDREAEAVALDAQLKKIEPDLKSANATIDRVSFGRGFFENRPPYLECLREVTLAFGYEEPIWATQFSLGENRKGSVRGKAATSEIVLSVGDRLKANRNFRNVTSADTRSGTGRDVEVTFTVNFEYVGTTDAAPNTPQPQPPRGSEGGRR